MASSCDRTTHHRDPEGDSSVVVVVNDDDDEDAWLFRDEIKVFSDDDAEHLLLHLEDNKESRERCDNDNDNLHLIFDASHSNDLDEDKNSLIRETEMGLKLEQVLRINAIDDKFSSDSRLSSGLVDVGLSASDVLGSSTGIGGPASSSSSLPTPFQQHMPDPMTRAPSNQSPADFLAAAAAAAAATRPLPPSPLMSSPPPAHIASSPYAFSLADQAKGLRNFYSATGLTPVSMGQADLACSYSSILTHPDTPMASLSGPFPRLKSSPFGSSSSAVASLSSPSMSRSSRKSRSSTSPAFSLLSSSKSALVSEASSVSASGSVPHIKKPLNAFMLYMKEMRPKIVAECTLKESAAINQILGRKWHALSREEQSKYYELARKERQLHMQMYPGWSARDNYAQSKKRKRKRLLQQHAQQTGNNDGIFETKKTRLGNGCSSLVIGNGNDDASTSIDLSDPNHFWDSRPATHTIRKESSLSASLASASLGSASCSPLLHHPPPPPLAPAPSFLSSEETKPLDLHSLHSYLESQHSMPHMLPCPDGVNVESNVLFNKETNDDEDNGVTPSNCLMGSPKYISL